VDLAEVLSARPAEEGGRTSHRQEQTVAFVAPETGLLPEALSRGWAARQRCAKARDLNAFVEINRPDRGATAHGGSHGSRLKCIRRPLERMGGAASARHVALLDVIVEVELSAPEAGAAAASSAAAAARAQKPTAAVSLSSAAAQSVGGRGTARIGAPACGARSAWTMATFEPTVERAAQLDVWKRREEARWRSALAEQEEKRLALLEREWKVHEARRAGEARAQARAMAATTKELQHKLAQVVKHEAILHATAERLHLHGAALERQARAVSLRSHL